MSDAESSGENHSGEVLEPDSQSESSEEQVIAKLVAPPTSLPPPPGPPNSLPPPPVLPPPMLDAESKDAENTESGPPSLEPPADAPTPPPVEELTSRFYKVLWDYPNPDNEEDTLTLHVGDMLIVLETRADGWWRGQSGSEVGLFPVAYCEPVSEEEVKAFIAQTESRQKKAAGIGAGSRAELEKEMKELQLEEAALAAMAQKLKDEVAAMKDEAKKMRKKTREELLEIFDTLPACLYHIPTFHNIQHDLVRCALQVGRILDIEVEHKEILPDVIEECSTFVDESSKTVAAEPKIKADLDKVVSKVLAIQKYLLDDHANVNIDLSRKVVDDLDILAQQINAFTRGEISTDTPRTEQKSSPASSVAHGDETSNPATAISDDTELSSPTSPREKKKKKRRDRGVTASTILPSPETETGTDTLQTPEKEPKDREKKKAKRKDKDTPASPRSPKRATIEGPSQDELQAAAEAEIPVSPRKNSKEKEKKSKRSKRETIEVDQEVEA